MTQSKLEQLIGEIMAEFDRLTIFTGTGQGPMPFETIGSKAKFQNLAPPQILWTHQGGTFDRGKITGGSSATIGVRVAQLTAWLWHRDGEGGCEAMFDVLSVAVYEKCGGPNVKAMSYTVPTQLDGHWLDHGGVWVARFDIEIPILREVDGQTATRVCTSHQHTVSLGTTVADTGVIPPP